MFLPDGQQLVSASKDQTVRLWDTATGAGVKVLNAEEALPGIWSSKDDWLRQVDSRLLHLGSSGSAYNSDGSKEYDLVPSATKSIRTSRLVNDRLFANKDWVSRDGQSLLWLPPDRRPVCSAVFGNPVVMGHGSGGVTFIEFKP